MVIAIAAGCASTPPPPLGAGDLPAVTFEANSGFQQNDTSVTFTVGSGTAEFTGGLAATRFTPPLYGDGSRSWMVSQANGIATINLSSLSVTRARFYFVHLDRRQPATLTFTDDAGTVSDPIMSVPVSGFLSGVPAGFMTIEAAAGATISTITITPPADGTEAALDSLVLSES